MTELAKQTTATKTTELATLRPLVTIIEEESGFTLTAELPGVPKENVKVQVENHILTLEGEILLQIPEQMESTHAEVSTAKYKRAFTLSRELDSSKIEASQSDGVLTLHIPKAEHAQPRKIEVQVG
ncbi:Hsp20/alpha crystallin family protein [uncultured Thiothrix sp.]|uniref:Hsp20/alpha crystallin family protein n=1 Tax=uncultured Thiothrix sp. TaxID=223185 RepID=UPI002619F4AE|nr:Hsp20/alpha crystallin family protein [uncultured Thiothrix sp.]HMT92061.1 Hsp20/alpha crystallin family protein [Thiolinea sp.]